MSKITQLFSIETIGKIFLQRSMIDLCNGSMKRIDFEKFLTLLSSDLYSFAFVLIPDDLQAGQLIVDSIGSYLISKKENIEELFNRKSVDLEQELFPMKKELLKLVYELARKRYHQLKLSINDHSTATDFFSLEMDEKASIYLRDKAKMSIDEISVITLNTKNEVLAYLFAARTKMVAAIPYEVQSGANQ